MSQLLSFYASITPFKKLNLKNIADLRISEILQQNYIRKNLKNMNKKKNIADLRCKPKKPPCYDNDSEIPRVV